MGYRDEYRYVLRQVAAILRAEIINNPAWLQEKDQNPDQAVTDEVWERRVKACRNIARWLDDMGNQRSDGPRHSTSRKASSQASMARQKPK